MDDAPLDVLADWGVPVAGLTLLGLSVASLLAELETSVLAFLDVTLPLLVGLALLALTPWFRGLDLDADQKLSILGAALLVGTLATGVMVWERYLLIVDGVDVPMDQSGQAALNGLAIGFLVGGVAGYYRARTKQELRDRSTAERSYREIFENVEDAVLVQDFETSAVLQANRKAAELFGYAREDLEGRVVPELTADHPEFDMDAATEKIQAARAGEPQRFEWLIERADGEERWVEISLKHAELNGEARLLAVLRDVSNERRRKEELSALADAREEFQEIFEKSDVGIALTDPETRTLGRINERYAELFGYERAEMEEMRMPDVTADDPEYSDERATNVIGSVMAGEPQQIEWPMERKDGSRFWAEVSLNRATIGDEVKLLTFIRDVTERKRRQEELEELAEARRDFQEIFEKADVGIALDDPETGMFERVNQQFGDLLGYEPEELVGEPITEISADDPDFDQEHAMGLIERAMAGDPQQFDWLCERKDGSTVWTEVSLKRSTIGGEDKLVVFVRDVSQRKASEQELNRHSDEMEFFNSLLRHDVLNAVTVIRTHGTRLVDTLDGQEREHAETVVEWADNVSGVIERVRDVLETLTGDRQELIREVDLTAMLRTEVDRIDATYSHVAIETDVPDGVVVVADDLLGDVFANVLSNAIDHNDTEDLTLSVSVETAETVTTVRIADTGSGIHDDDKEAVFRRGATGHVKKTGSGFGLFFVDSMIEAYGGDVWVEDNEPSGTAVVIELPTWTE